MSAAVITKNNVMAGGFLICSILLALIIAFTLGDVMSKFGSKDEYIVEFPTTVGVAGLTNGAEVSFAGMPIGEVIGVEPFLQEDPETGLMIPHAMHVRINIQRGITLHEDAFADLAPPILGGVSRINIASAGVGSHDSGPTDENSILDPGEIIRGRFSPSILAQLGFTTEESERIKDVIARAQSIAVNADDISASFRRMTLELEPEFGTGVQDGRATIANIRTFSDKLNAPESGWSSRIDGVFDKTHGVIDNATQITNDIKDTTSTVKDMVDTNREPIERIVSNVDEITNEVRGHINPTTEKINDLLERGTLALSSFQEVGNNANTLLLDAQPKISATLDNVRMTSTQGNLFLEEIRAQPWRLLAKPKKEELAREPLYEAARAYASAVGDLRAASEALDAAVAGEIVGVSAIDIARIAKVVEAAYDRYEIAEQGILEALKIPETP